jgi:ArsR family transcriptional regulator, lead/cadmium/zinc/bismuth-responsive transcriptional repressor
MNLTDNLNLLKALSEESRYRIVEVLLEGERCACELPGLIKRTQSNTSMHLTRLVVMGVLASRRDGKKIIYSIKDLRVCDIFRSLGHPETKILKPYSCMEKVCRI